MREWGRLHGGHRPAPGRTQFSGQEEWRGEWWAKPTAGSGVASDPGRGSYPGGFRHSPRYSDRGAQTQARRGLPAVQLYRNRYLSRAVVVLFGSIVAVFPNRAVGGYGTGSDMDPATKIAISFFKRPYLKRRPKVHFLSLLLFIYHG
jgi:hypothetical protein